MMPEMPVNLLIGGSTFTLAFSVNESIAKPVKDLAHATLLIMFSHFSFPDVWSMKWRTGVGQDWSTVKLLTECPFSFTTLCSSFGISPEGANIEQLTARSPAHLLRTGRIMRRVRRIRTTFTEPVCAITGRSADVVGGAVLQFPTRREDGPRSEHMGYLIFPNTTDYPESNNVVQIRSYKD